MPSDGKSSLCLWQGELKKIGTTKIAVKNFSKRIIFIVPRFFSRHDKNKLQLTQDFIH
jgi:hypothetical protein